MVLLGSLLLVTVSHPIAPDGLLVDQLLNGVFALMLLAALLSVSREQRLFFVALVLAIPAIVLIWGVYLAARTGTSVGDLAMSGRFLINILFLCLVAGCILRDILRADRVTTDRLCGAMSIYLLLGVIWALLFSLIAHADATAFAVHVEALAEQSANRGEDHKNVHPLMIYYSFVTLSTLGYGDITPVAPAARVFAWLEAVVGQLYLAVLIARLVGLHIAQSRRDEKEVGNHR